MAYDLPRISLLIAGLYIAHTFGFRDFFADTIFFVQPPTQIDQLASPTAKRAVRNLVAGNVSDLPETNWTR